MLDPLATLQARHAHRSEMLDVMSRLMAEFAGVHPPGTVVAHVARTREDLLRRGVRVDLVRAVEAAARVGLAQRAPAHAPALRTRVAKVH